MHTLSALVVLTLFARARSTECDFRWPKLNPDIKWHKLFYNSKSPAELDSSTLKFVTVVFRHGDRTPDTDEKYPLDPYFNETYYPIGYGQLTKVGFLGEYNIGKELRKRYDEFLDDVYTPGLLYARSTDYDRTKNSLQLVLAGLFPPVESEVWNEELFWQPIPFDYEKRNADILLGDPNTACPKFREQYELNLRSNKNLQQNQKLQEFYNYISNNTGLNVTGPAEIYNLYFALFAEESLGFTLPEWTECVWPGMITDIATQYYTLASETPLLKSYSYGLFLKSIADNATAKINGDESMVNRKMILYSGHERNVAMLLLGLGVFYPHVPPYSSYVLIELHEVKGVYGFQVLYQDYMNHKPRLLTIPGCSAFCPFNDFYNIIAKLFPTSSC